MNNTPLFSVLIANYNNGRYLMDAVESVRTQSYSNWEIIIVDDGSSDNSFDVYKQLETDSRIHVFPNGVNKGCGYTKRRCAELASGILCGFLDADDVLLPNALKSHADSHMHHPEVSCVFSRFYYCDQQLNITNELRKLNISVNKNYFTNREYLPEHFTSFKKDCYLRTEGISPDLHAGVDQDLYFKLEEVAPVYVLDSFTYKYRSTPSQISQGERWITTLYWNLVVRQRTCERRHLQPEEFPIQDLIELIAEMQNEHDKTKQELIRTRSSRAFLLGKTLLHPFTKRTT